MVGLFYAVGYWNDYFHASLYLDSGHWPLPAVLRTYVIAGHAARRRRRRATPARWPRRRRSRWRCVVVATVPILPSTPSCRSYFTKGVLTGAVKS